MKNKIDAHKPYSPQPIRWVGLEMNLKNAWLYFEVRGEQNPGQWRVENKLFFELNEDQINQVQLDVGEPTQLISLSLRKSYTDVKTGISVGPVSARGKQLGR